MLQSCWKSLSILSLLAFSIPLLSGIVVADPPVCTSGQLPTVTGFALTSGGQIIGGSTQSFSGTVSISCQPGAEPWGVDFSTSPSGILAMADGEQVYGSASFGGNAPGVVSQPVSVTITAWTGEGFDFTASSSVTVTVVPFSLSISRNSSGYGSGTGRDGRRNYNIECSF